MNQITTSSSFLFKNCMSGITIDVEGSLETFNEIYKRCDDNNVFTSTTENLANHTSSTTENWETEDTTTYLS